MRASNNYRSGSSISRTIITEENDDEVELNNSQNRNNSYPRSSAPTIHFSKSSIITPHNGKVCFMIN
jgi:hypothetical protein